MSTSVTPPILQTKKQNDDIRGKMQPIIAKPIMQNSMKIKTRNFKKNFILKPAAKITVFRIFSLSIIEYILSAYYSQNN